MSLAPGTRLGPYELIAPLGAGGMGEVYRAKDSRLGRTVAIKVLPPDTAADSSARVRFEREARAIAALSHPNICVVHDVGREGSTDYLVMELLDGETLSERLAKSKGPLPLDEVLTIGTAIADALDKAHRAGIVHRDLKPANVMLTKSGPKLLDFGLAKLHSRESTPVALSGGTTASTMVPGTAHGTILGTLHYMAPEQVEGREADARADIWALGALLYEMATGTRPFEGESPASVLGAILKDTPAPLSSRQPLTPPAFEHVVERCLEKDPDERWQSVRDVKRALMWIASERSHTTAHGPSALQPVTRRTRAFWAWIAGAFAATLIAGIVSGRALSRTTSAPREIAHLQMGVAPAESIEGSIQYVQAGDPSARPSRAALTISPDGRTVIFTGLTGGTTRLFKRTLDDQTAVAVDGTDNGNGPFFSPDGRWVAFAANGKLRRMPTVSGPATDICDLGAGNRLWGGDWGSDGTVVFSVGSAILRVPAAGGTPQEVVRSEGIGLVVLPHWLPGERRLLYTTNQGREDWAAAHVVARSLDTGDVHTVVEGGTDARYLPTGHLLYMKNGTLVAAPFDVERGEITGASVTLVNDVMHAVNSGSSEFNQGTGQFAVSASGVLAYLRGGIAPNRSIQPTWVDKGGTETPVAEPPGSLNNPRLSPDGRLLAFARARPDSVRRDIWVRDLSRGASSRLTFGDGYRASNWSPDGKWLVFGDMNREGLYRLPVGSGGVPERLTPVSQRNVTAGWASKNGVLVYVAGSPTELWTLNLTGDPAPKPLLRGNYSLSHPAISPDGRWVAYRSDETGRGEVYVQAYPELGSKTLISPGGGTEPVWAKNGRQLFFTRPAYATTGTRLAMMAVDIDTSHGLTAGAPRLLFEGPYTSTGPLPAYDVSDDGRFIMMKVVKETERVPVTQIEVVLNWTEQLKRLVPEE